MSRREEPDPLIDEIRAIRAQISREHGDDVRRLGEHYMELQRHYRGTMISAPPPAPPKQDKSAA
jgi:hypothetical protein